MDNQDSSATAWEETGAVVRPAAWAGRSTPASAGSSGVRLPSDEEFISILTPCLNLVAPVGMDVDTQDAWLESATMVLADIPVDLLRRGASAAMKVADHHSKIVPAIIAEVERLRASDRHVERVWQGADNAPQALPAPGGERPTANEVDEICKRFAVGRYAKDRMADSSPASPTRVAATADPARPCRAPSREDYIRLFGIDPGTAEPPAEAAA